MNEGNAGQNLEEEEKEININDLLIEDNKEE